MKIFAFLTVICAASQVLAAGTSDPDWPCVQRRQPQLSIAQLWSGPLPDKAAIDLAKTPEIQRIAQIISLRRTTIEEADKIIAEFAGIAGDQKLVALFQASFEHIQSARNKVMAGIARYTRKQNALDKTIIEKRREFNTLSKAEPKDFDAIDRAEEELEWSTRIFQDRQQALTYVCETPVVLEQRIFSIGRSIAGHLEE